MKKKSKKKNEDFKKVKLKVGKKLIKPHETNTAFKSRTVVLLEQLKNADSETPSTQKKLTVPDLLRHLRHYNPNFRLEGLNDLKSLLTSHRHLIAAHLSSILEGIGPLMTDADGRVLAANESLWEMVLSSISSNEFTPFFPLVAAHVNCSLTHLKAGVKKHAVKVLLSIMEKHENLLFDCSLDLYGNCLLLYSESKQNPTGQTLVTKEHKLFLLSIAERLLKCLDNRYKPEMAESENDLEKLPETKSVSPESLVSVSLFRREWPHFTDTIPVLGDAQRSNPQGKLTLRFISFVERIIPFCHRIFVEVTSQDIEDKSERVSAFDEETLLLLNRLLDLYIATLTSDGEQLRFCKQSTDEETKFYDVIRFHFSDKFLHQYRRLQPLSRHGRRIEKDFDVCSTANEKLDKIFRICTASVLRE